MNKYNLFKIFTKRLNFVNVALNNTRNQFNINYNKYNIRNYSIPKLITPYKYSSDFRHAKFPPPTNFLLCLSILGWLGFIDEDKDKESELIMTLKRAILCQQREEYDKSEILLHVALRLAQQQQNQQGVLYTYDLMANLAFEKLDLKKAEILFVNVLQRLLANGAKEDDLRVIHISLKLARICHLLAEPEKAEVGYKWCLEKIENQKENPDARNLYGVIQDWYAQFLLDENRVKESLTHLKEAYKICCDVKGAVTEESLLLLNDLGTTSWRAGDLFNAELFLTQAIGVGNAINSKEHLGVVHANLGLIYLQKGIAEEAKKYCKEAWQLGRRYENVESIEQASYCLDQIKVVLGH